MYDLLKLNQEVINHLNRSIGSNEIKAVIKSLPAKKRPGPDRFIAEFQTFKGELTPVVLKLFLNEKEGTLPDSTYEASITQIPRPGKNTTKNPNIS
jgi:hypothetical protein